MSHKLHFAIIYQVVLSDQIFPDLPTRAALKAIFNEFDVNICSGTPDDDTFEIDRAELIRLRDTIRDGGEEYDSHADELQDILAEMKLSEDELVAGLDQMIRESAQNEDRVIFTWM